VLAGLLLLPGPALTRERATTLFAALVAREAGLAAGVLSGA
jgi:hypothetical protein